MNFLFIICEFTLAVDIYDVATNSFTTAQLSEAGYNFAGGCLHWQQGFICRRPQWFLLYDGGCIYAFRVM